jgi:hypothetical protein
LAVVATPATGSAVEALRPYSVGDPAHLLSVVEEQVGHRLIALAVGELVLGRPRHSVRPARTLPTGGHHRRVRAHSFVCGGVPQIATAITHLRDVLGEATYESLARKGETMTTAAMATYAYDQIDQARTGLEHPSCMPPQERERFVRSTVPSPGAGIASYVKRTFRSVIRPNQ